MNTTIWIISGIAILIALLLATGWWRYVLTGYLIARVAPYEQAGSGVGSILVIGDSTGYGTGASRSSESFAGRLGADFPAFSIKNDSVNGRQIAGAMEVAQNLTDTDQYDLVVLQIGANDLIAGRAAGQVATELQQLIETVIPHTKQIVVVSAGNIGATALFTGKEAEDLEASSRLFDQQMQQLDDSYDQVAFVSLFDEPADDPFVQQPEKYTSIDDLHPTSVGYEIWYNKSKPAFKAVLDDSQ